MDEHKEHLHEIAQNAAALHGQEWGKLPMWSRDRWIETVKHTGRGSSGVNEMERCAGQAIDEWYKRKEAPPQVIQPEAVEAVEAVEAEPATLKQKTKTKK